MILSHRIALDPTKKQEAYFKKACGTHRFVWNWALAEWNKQYAAGQNPTGFKLAVSFNAVKYKLFPWLKEIHRDAHKKPFVDLHQAFKKFRAQETSHPKFKKRGDSKDSFYAEGRPLRCQSHKVCLPRIGWIKMHETLRFQGKLISATVLRIANRWFLSARVDTEPKVKPAPNRADIVGVDLGIKHAATLSTGETLDGPKPLKQELKKLKRIQRAVSRKQKGSQNRKKAVLKLAKLHARIANVRGDFLHKLTTRLCRENQAVAIEDLNVRGMKSNHKLAKAMLDESFYELRRQLEYKAPMHGTRLVVVDRWLPSSKTCSRCGVVKEKLSLKERTYECEQCGLSLDRDINAALNIRTAGLAGIDACAVPNGSVAHTRASSRVGRNRKKMHARKAGLGSGLTTAEN